MDDVMKAARALVDEYRVRCLWYLREVLEAGSLRFHQGSIRGAFSRIGP